MHEVSWHPAGVPDVEQTESDVEWTEEDAATPASKRTLHGIWCTLHCSQSCLQGFPPIHRIIIVVHLVIWDALFAGVQRDGLHAAAVAD